MGTRNLTMVVLDNEIKVAQYGQWDGYPEGQGQTVFNFVADGKADEQFVEKVKASKFHEKGEEIDDTLPEWSRNTAAEVLDIIREREPGIILHNSRVFAYDSLFCEWAYLLDLDRRVLEVYKGFNKKPVKHGRFRSTDPEMKDPSIIGKEYHPVVLIDQTPLEFIKDGTCTFENFLDNILMACKVMEAADNKSF